METTMNGIITKSSVGDIIKLLPDEIQAQLIQISCNWRTQKWWIGDIVNYLKALVRERAFDASIIDCYKAVAYLLNQEVSWRTVEHIGAIAAFYSDPIRVEFDDLPFSHFATAMKYGDRWREVLELSQFQMGEYGKPPSAEWLEWRMAGGVNIVPPEPGSSPEIPDILTESGETLLISEQGYGELGETRTVIVEAMTVLRRLIPFGGRLAKLVNEIIEELEKIS